MNSVSRRKNRSTAVVRLMRASGISIFLFGFTFLWFAFYVDVDIRAAAIASCVYSLVAFVGVSLLDKFLHALILSIPTLFTSKGRVVLLSVALSLLTREVISNVKLNTQEIQLLTSCIKESGAAEASRAGDQVMTHVNSMLTKWLQLGDEFHRNLRTTSALTQLFAQAFQDMAQKNKIYANLFSGTIIGDRKFGMESDVRTRLEVNATRAVNTSLILEALTTQFGTITHILDVFSQLLQIVSLLSGMLLLISSWRYLQHFLTSNSFHNVYVEHATAVQHLRHTKYANKYVELRSWTLARSEVVHIKMALPIFIVDVLIGAVTLFYDAVIAWLLQSMRKAVNTEIPISGTIEWGWDVQSSVKLSQTSYNLHQPYNFSVSFRHCAPVAHAIGTEIYVKVAILFCLTFLCLMLSGYAQRVQHILLNFWYPDRAEERKKWQVRKLYLQRSRRMSIDSLDSGSTLSQKSKDSFNWCFLHRKNGQKIKHTKLISTPRDVIVENVGYVNGWRWTKRILASLIVSAALYGLTIAYFCLVLQWNVILAMLIGFPVLLTTLVGSFSSYRFMATMVVMFPSLLASQGRYVLLILGMVVVLTGPGFNAINNVSQFVDSTSCAAMANYNFAKELRTTTAEQAQLAIQKWTSIVGNANKFVESEYVKFVEQTEKERSWFDRLVSGASSKLCAGLLPALCPPSSTAQKATFNINLHKIKVTDTNETTQFMSDVFSKLQNRAQSFKSITWSADKVTRVLNAIMEFLSLLVAFLATYHYLRKWSTSKKFDNRYVNDEITRECLKIAEQAETDEECNVHEEMQRAEYIRSTTLRLSRCEIQQIASGAFGTVFNVTVAASVIIFDMLITVLLSTLMECKHAVTLHTQGTINLDYEFKGLGELSYYRNRGTIAVDSFSMPLDSMLSDCMRRPTYTSKQTYLNIAALYGAAALTLLTLAYMQRLRIKLLDSLYPQQGAIRKQWLIEKICMVKMDATAHLNVTSPV